MEGAPSAWGPYALGRRIGRGAMGVVHAALHRNAAGIARLVAVKILVADRADHAEERAAFLREARILARLDHPNVVRWLDAGEIDGDVFIAMELLHGASLAQIVAASPERLPLPVAIAVIADLARGLHAAHELRDEAGQALGLVHQDVSPQNAVVGYDGRTRLVDFGIARLASVDASRTDTVRGKPAYLAPEQLEGRRLDRRTDVFALGVIAFEILAGRRLFARASIAETHTAVLFEPILSLRDVRPEMPSDLAAVIARALSRSPGGRFDTAEAFRRALVAARDDARIPAADEREIADLVAERVPPPWRPHELFAEIDAGLAGPEEDARGAPEVSQAATIAPRRERSARDLAEEPTRAPVRDLAEEPTRAPVRGTAEQMLGIPSNAPAPMVGIPSNAPAQVVGVPSDRSEPSLAAPEVPRSRTPAWLQGVLLAGAVLLALVVVMLSRRTVREPSAQEVPAASAAAPAEAPQRRVEDVAVEPTASATASSSAANRSAPAHANSVVAPSFSPGATAAATTGPTPPSVSAPSAAPSASVSSAPSVEPALPSATSAPVAAAEPPASGWISVWSTPWGRVRVDGRDVGDSPAIRVAAPPGPHSVSVKSESGEQARSVTVKPGEESKVRFVF